jgi:hypothetical protein
MPDNENEQPEEDQPLEQQEVDEGPAAEEITSDEAPSSPDGSEAEEATSEEVATSDEAPSSPDGSEAEEATPQASFSSLVTFIAAQTVVALGEGSSEQEEKPAVRLDIARYHIDTLVVLQEKTQGHLSKEEGALVEQYLHQLRMLYVSGQKNDEAAPA